MHKRVKRVLNWPDRRAVARDASAYRLNVYHTAIREIEAMTDDAWQAAWVMAVRRGARDIPYTPRLIWLDTLRTYAINESIRLAVSVTDAA